MIKGKGKGKISERDESLIRNRNANTARIREDLKISECNRRN